MRLVQFLKRKCWKEICFVVWSLMSKNLYISSSTFGPINWFIKENSSIFILIPWLLCHANLTIINLEIQGTKDILGRRYKPTKAFQINLKCTLIIPSPNKSKYRNESPGLAIVATCTEIYYQGNFQANHISFWSDSKIKVWDHLCKIWQ